MNEYRHAVPNGWDGWVVTPPEVAGPPAASEDAVALNFMGRQGWEVVQIESVLDGPPNGIGGAGVNRRQYLMKRPLP